MSWFGRQDPGPCPICGAAHHGCTSDDGTVTLMPARDAAAARAAQQPDPVAPLGDGSDDRPFSTGTYRGSRKRRTRTTMNKRD